MTKVQAIQRARAKAKRIADTVFIVWSDEPDDEPGHHYHTATDYQLDTFFNGLQPIIAVQPDGMVEGL